MTEQTETPQIAIISRHAVSLDLVRAELNGETRWILVYTANVDGTVHEATVCKSMLGCARDTPADALDQIASLPLGAFGI